MEGDKAESTSKLMKKEVLNEDQCMLIIKKKLAQESLEEEFTVIAYEIEPLEIANSGYLVNYFNVKAKVAKRKLSKRSYKFNFFVKSVPSEGSLVNLMKDCQSYEREIFFYETIFPTVFIPPIGETCIPDCYLTVKNTTVVLENLTDKNFVTKDKFGTLDFDHCMLVIENLAYFHAQSFSYEDKADMSVKEFCEEQDMPLDSYDLQESLEYHIDQMVTVIDIMPELDDGVKESYKEEISRRAAHFYEKINPTEGKRNVLCHFDLWTCNILFKYDSDGDVEKCYFVDFQWVRYGLPALDIWYFIYTTTTKDFRRSNCQEILKSYYGRLTEILKEQNIDIANIFTKDQFMEMLKEMQIYMLIYSIAAVGITTLNPIANRLFRSGELPFSEIFPAEIRGVEVYKKRIIELFAELCELLKP